MTFSNACGVLLLTIIATPLRVWHRALARATNSLIADCSQEFYRDTFGIIEIYERAIIENYCSNLFSPFCLSYPIPRLMFQSRFSCAPHTGCEWIILIRMSQRMLFSRSENSFFFLVRMRIIQFILTPLKSLFGNEAYWLMPLMIYRMSVS